MAKNNSSSATSKESNDTGASHSCYLYDPNTSSFCIFAKEELREGAAYEWDKLNLKQAVERDWNDVFG